jgi:putative ABC transport system permease protein
VTCLAVIDLTWWDLSLAAALILVNAGASLALRLGLERRLLVASLRTVVQLSFLGLVLQWVFRQPGPWAVVGMMLVMTVLAGWEAVRRTTYRVRGGYLISMSVMFVASMTVTLYGVVVVLGVRPWYTPAFAIPILGMLLGNTLNGISLGLETALEGFRRDRLEVEMLLAHGATRREASRDVVRRAVRTGMIPILNSMIAAGLISIPGMMTGQILAGQDPASAARYQIFILFSIAAGVALGTMGMVFVASRIVFDDRDRLRAERIRRVGRR